MEERWRRADQEGWSKEGGGEEGKGRVHLVTPPPPSFASHHLHPFAPVRTRPHPSRPFASVSRSCAVVSHLFALVCGRVAPSTLVCDCVAPVCAYLHLFALVPSQGARGCL